MLTVRPLRHDDTSDVLRLEERARGTGIGTMLYRELASHARGLRAAALCCEVNTSLPNPGSLAFHERMGFNRIGVIKTVDGRIITLLKREL